MKSKGFIAFLFLAVLLLSTFTCAGGGSAATPTPTPAPTPTPMPTPPAGYLTYTDEDNGFSFWYPDSWEQMEEVLEPFAVRFKSPAACVPAGGTGIVWSPWFGVWEPWYGLSLQDEFDDFNSGAEELEGYVSISVEELTINGVPAMKHVFTHYTGQAVQPGVAPHQTQRAVVMCAKAGKIFGLFCGAIPECWEENEPIFDTIIHSFQILD